MWGDTKPFALWQHFTVSEGDLEAVDGIKKSDWTLLSKHVSHFVPRNLNCSTCRLLSIQHS